MLNLDVVVGASSLWTIGGSHGAPLPFTAAACDTASQMELPLTLTLAGGFVAMAVFAGWRGARPPNPHRGPRLVPWRFLMLLAAVGVLASWSTW